MSQSTYQRAIASFERLLEPTQQQRIETPAALIRAADLPSSTGYRHLSKMEGAGLLNRDKRGAYAMGPAALRIGLSALGFGHLAALAPPILVRLRETTGYTTFLALVDGDSLTICVFSIGRGANASTPARRYLFPQASQAAANGPKEVHLKDTTTAPGRSVRTVLCPVPETSSAHIGIFGNSDTAATERIKHQLQRCAELFRAEL